MDTKLINKISDNGEFTEVLIEKGNLTTLQIQELIDAYFVKKERILNRKFTADEKIAISLIFHEAIENGKCTPGIIMELMLPSNPQPFKEFKEGDPPLEIQFRKPPQWKVDHEN